VTFRQAQAAALALAAMIALAAERLAAAETRPDRNRFATADRRWSRAGVRPTAAMT
jgi:hypothetical protein